MGENDNNQMTPFGQQRSLMAVDPAAVAAGEAVKARIQSAYIMAYQNPRNVDEARARILKLCRIPEFAEKVEYGKPIGGKTIKGLSIRFAEPALSLYRNILTEAQLLHEDDNIKRLRISALDLEGNTQFSRDISIKKTVERKSLKGRKDDLISERQNSYNETVYLLRATEDEVMTKESAYVSKFIRTEGLRLIPVDIKNEAIRVSRETLSQRDKEDPNAAKKRILDAFSGLNIWPKDLEKYIGHSVDTISPAEITDLRTVYSAIESGEATWADYTNREKPEPKTGAPKSEQPKESGKQKADPEDDKPKTDPAFAAMVKKQTGEDFDYTPTKDGKAGDLLSAYLELVGSHNDLSPFVLMERFSEPGTFPGFWNGFEAGTWQHHFDGELPEPKKDATPQETGKSAEAFTGHRSSQEGPPDGTTMGGEKKDPENNKPDDDSDGIQSQFDIVDWKASGLKKVGLKRYWDSNTDEWEHTSEAGKAAFEEKWLRVFTTDGMLELPCPWKPVRQPGDDAEPEDTGPIDYHAKLVEVQVQDPEGLVKACEAFGYGTNVVIPMSEPKQKELYETYLEIKG